MSPTKKTKDLSPFPLFRSFQTLTEPYYQKCGKRSLQLQENHIFLSLCRFHFTGSTEESFSK